MDVIILIDHVERKSDVAACELVDIGYLQCLFKYKSRCWDVFLIWPDIFLFGWARS